MDVMDRLSAAAGVGRVQGDARFSMSTKDCQGLADGSTADTIFYMRDERGHSLGTVAGELPPVAQAIAGADPVVIIGAVAIAGCIRSVVEHWVIAHQEAAPIIEVAASDRATAIWPFFDLIEDGREASRGYGRYHDEYRKVDGTWRISFHRITGIPTDGAHPWSVQALEPVA